ncbi:MAG: CPBP family glutamic-type intramembrane protease [Salibacteraceae bacterium]
MREAIRSAHPLIQLGVLVLLGFGAMFVLMMLAMGVFLSMGWGLDVITDPMSLADGGGEKMIALKVFQLVQSIGLFFAPYLIYLYFIKEKSYPLALVKGRWLMLLVFGATMISALPLINFVAEWNSGLHLPGAFSSIEDWMRQTEKQAEVLIRSFLHMETVGDLLFNLFLIAFIPALCEEVFFRGTMQPILLKVVKNYHGAIWLTAFLFSFFHMQFLGFFPRLLLGAVFGYAAHWSGSLILPMAGHLINNGLAVLITWYIGLEAIDEQVETIGANSGEMRYAILSLAVVTAGMVSLYFSSKRIKKAAIDQDSGIQT